VRSSSSHLRAFKGFNQRLKTSSLNLDFSFSLTLVQMVSAVSLASTEISSYPQDYAQGSITPVDYLDIFFRNTYCHVLPFFRDSTPPKKMGFEERRV
jgi:hypothetical protein